MKELEKNLEATGGVPAEAELAAINRFAKSPLRAEEVYTFSLRLCDNEVDRDWERFDTAALNTLGDLFVGKSGIFDHQWTAEGQTARIYRTEMVREGAQVTAVGDGYCWLKAWAYLLRTEKNADLIAEIEGPDFVLFGGEDDGAGAASFGRLAVVAPVEPVVAVFVVEEIEGDRIGREVFRAESDASRFGLFHTLPGACVAVDIP